MAFLSPFCEVKHYHTVNNLYSQKQAKNKPKNIMPKIIKVLLFFSKLSTKNRFFKKPISRKNRIIKINKKNGYFECMNNVYFLHTVVCALHYHNITNILLFYCISNNTIK